MKKWAYLTDLVWWIANVQSLVNNLIQIVLHLEFYEQISKACQALSKKAHWGWKEIVAAMSPKWKFMRHAYTFVHHMQSSSSIEILQKISVEQHNEMFTILIVSLPCGDRKHNESEII